MIRLELVITEKSEPAGTTNLDMNLVDWENPTNAEKIALAETTAIFKQFATKGKERPDFLTDEQWEILKQSTIEQFEILDSFLKEYQKQRDGNREDYVQ